ncbi:hypothetical protein K7432_008132 [Basidiobolus ranarum]|uniref:Uncharacterized protein n=1 Tax=Basidiobolus ranarum TaxID=34480 RepID=A0ABR2WS90_9FUNG
MSALEAPLDIANEKSTDLKSSLSNDSFQSGKTGRKLATSVESKAKRRQAKLKRKNSDKPLFEAYHDKNSSMEEISVRNTYATTNQHTPPMESTIKPESLNDESLLPEQSDTLCSVESVINQKDNIYSDKSDNPLNLIPLAISTCPSHFMDRPSSAYSAPQENFLELLVQAAFSQEANTPASIRTNQSPPDSNHSKHPSLEPSLPETPDLTKSDSGDNSENVAHPTSTFTTEEKRTHTYNHQVNQPSVNPPLLNLEGCGPIEAENTYHSNRYVNDTSKTVIPMVPESVVQFDPKDAQVMEETITYGVEGAPGTLSSIHTTSQGVNQEPPNQVNLHIKDSTDISSPVNVRIEYGRADAGTNNSQSMDWHVRDTGCSASLALDFSKDTTPAALQPQAIATLQKPSNSSRHTWQGDNVINCYQMPHKLPDQKPQPIQQLQLLQLQPLSTDVAQISP